MDVPALGGMVRIRACSVQQRTSIERIFQGANADEARQRLIVMAVVKPEGLTAKHVAQIAQHDASSLEPLIEAITELWMLGKQKEQVDALEKNSEATAN